MFNELPQGLITRFSVSLIRIAMKRGIDWSEALLPQVALIGQGVEQGGNSLSAHFGVRAIVDGDRRCLLTLPQTGGRNNLDLIQR